MKNIKQERRIDWKVYLRIKNKRKKMIFFAINIKKYMWVYKRFCLFLFKGREVVFGHDFILRKNCCSINNKGHGYECK